MPHFDGLIYDANFENVIMHVGLRCHHRERAPTTMRDFRRLRCLSRAFNEFSRTSIHKLTRELLRDEKARRRQATVIGNFPVRAASGRRLYFTKFEASPRRRLKESHLIYMRDTPQAMDIASILRTICRRALPFYGPLV